MSMERKMRKKSEQEADPARLRQSLCDALDLPEGIAVSYTDTELHTMTLKAIQNGDIPPSDALRLLEENRDLAYVAGHNITRPAHATDRDGDGYLVDLTLTVADLGPRALHLCVTAANSKGARSANRLVTDLVAHCVLAGNFEILEHLIQRDFLGAEPPAINGAFQQINQNAPGRFTEHPRKWHTNAGRATLDCVARIHGKKLIDDHTLDKWIQHEIECAILKDESARQFQQNASSPWRPARIHHLNSVLLAFHDTPSFRLSMDKLAGKTVTIGFDDKHTGSIIRNLIRACMGTDKNQTPAPPPLIHPGILKTLDYLTDDFIRKNQDKNTPVAIIAGTGPGTAEMCGQYQIWRQGTHIRNEVDRQTGKGTPRTNPEGGAGAITRSETEPENSRNTHATVRKTGAIRGNAGTS